MAKAVVDNNGFIEIKDNKLSKAGVFQYLGKEISPELVPDRVYNVLRSTSTLSSQECIDSFKLQPWVINHTMLGKKFDSPAEKKGIHGVIGENVYFDDKDGWLKGNIKIFSDELEEEIKDGIDELSLGFECDYHINVNGVYEGKSYEVEQKNMMGNHLASVEKSRMQVAVMDQRSYGVDHMTIKLKADDEDNSMVVKAKAEDKDSLILAQLQKMNTRMAAMDEKMDAMEKKAKDEESKKAEDEEEEKKSGMDTEEKAKDTKDEDDKDKAKAKDNESEKKSGMDAAAVTAAVQNAVKPLMEKIGTLEEKAKGMDSAVILGEFAKRDELYQNLSKHTGAFDHSVMDRQKVAEYGVEKLGLPCEKGTEIASINAYLHNRAAPSESPLFVVGSGQDSSSAEVSPIKSKIGES